MDVKCVSFNCLGYKSSFAFINSLCNEYDICFICEHWLRPHELSVVKSNLGDDGKWCYLKSSVDPEAVLSGRSYGGVGFICKQKKGISFRIINTSSDRISGFMMCHYGKPLLCILGVYMPFFNGAPEQIQLYAETLDKLQNAMNTSAEHVPIMIMGDLNATLPSSSSCLNDTWNKSIPFNKNSMLMFDFICENGLIIENFRFHQSVNYTYEKVSTRSYIDHILTTEQASSFIYQCDILNVSQRCLSDHLPVAVKLVLPYESTDDSSYSGGSINKPVNFPWKTKDFTVKYQKCVIQTVSEVKFPTSSTIKCKSDAQKVVDKYSKDITSALHTAATRALDLIPMRRKPLSGKQWWNQDCQSAKRRHKFWFSIWHSCGRPREGVMYDTYKHAKYVYRKACRSASNKAIRMNFASCDALLRSNQMSKFWNKIRSVKDQSYSDHQKTCIKWGVL